MLILGGLGVQFERLGDTIAPMEQHANRAGQAQGSGEFNCAGNVSLGVSSVP